MTVASNFYTDRRDSIPTVDSDLGNSILLEIDWASRYQSPITVTASAPVVEQTGGNLVISAIDATTDRLIFRATGAGARVKFVVTFGSPSQIEIVDVRIMAV